MFTDKKITKRTTNRKSYYAPSERDVQCPFLTKDDNGDIRIVPDAHDSHTVRRIRRCLCTEMAPFCSYHLSDGFTEEIIAMEEVERVEVERTPVVDENGDPLIQENEVTIRDTVPVPKEVQRFYCHRYEFMREDSDAPVDTHNRILKATGYELKWI